MKLFLSILTSALCASLSSASTDCLDANRYNLESVCRKECEQEDAVAFAVTYDENIDFCRCYKSVEGLGTYTGDVMIINK